MTGQAPLAEGLLLDWNDGDSWRSYMVPPEWLGVVKDLDDLKAKLIAYYKG